jgi:hypothetical protein
VLAPQLHCSKTMEYKHVSSAKRVR